jgi:lipopolysaccharide/colanic/teichoic acid biosynthesis glycosyltransferase
MNARGLPRSVDLVIALALLAAAAPLLGVVAIAVGTTSPGGVLFRHRRMGRGGRPFEMLKFRTMQIDREGPEVTAPDDVRITPVGRWLRKSKLDELPELWNVVRGEMALVGPRPEALRYVAVANQLWQPILQVRPGVTDPVSVRLRHEEALLAAAGGNHERFYREYLLPYKLRAGADYLARRTWQSDLRILWQTVLAVIAPSRIAAASLQDIIAKAQS